MDNQGGNDKSDQAPFSHTGAFSSPDDSDGQNAGGNDKDRFDPVLVKVSGQCDPFRDRFRRRLDITIVQSRDNQTKDNVYPEYGLQGIQISVCFIRHMDSRLIISFSTVSPLIAVES